MDLSQKATSNDFANFKYCKFVAGSFSAVSKLMFEIKDSFRKISFLYF